MKLFFAADVKFTFTSPNGRRTKDICFQLYDTPLARRWANIVQREMKHERYQGWRLGHHSTRSQNIETVSLELHKLINHINENYKDRGFELPVWDHPQTKSYSESTQILNRLHEEFHKQEDRQERKEKIDKLEFATHKEKVIFSQAIQKLNTKIHQLEGCYESLAGTSSKTQGYAVMQTNMDHKAKIREEITDEMRKWFVYDRPVDREIVLTVSYSTIGKDLYTCCDNNDVDLVRSGLVSAKIDFSSEVIINNYYQKSNSSPLACLMQQMEKTQKMLQWVFENNLQNDIDVWDPKHFYAANPIIGYATTRLTPDEFDLIIGEWKLSNFDLDVRKGLEDDA